MKRFDAQERMSRWVFLAIAALILAASARPVEGGRASGPDTRGRQEQERPSFGANVELVTVNVAVLDNRGAPVRGLEADDFSVVEDGVEREVAMLLTPSDTPLDLGVILDLSGSMVDAPWLPRTERLLEALEPGDCVLLVGFRGTVDSVGWAPPAATGLRVMIEEAPAADGTALFDALLTAIAEMSGPVLDEWLLSEFPEPVSGQIRDRVRATQGSGCPVRSNPNDAGQHDRGRRRALIVITDGWDTYSEYGEGDVLLAALTAGIPLFQVYTVSEDVTRPSSTASSEIRERGIRVRVRGRRRLNELTKTTGGRVLNDASGYEDILNQLRGSYVIGYYVPASEERSAAEPSIMPIPGISTSRRFHGVVCPRSNVKRAAALPL